MKRITMKRTRAASIAVVAIAGLALSGCSDDTTAVSSASKQEIADGVAAAKAFAAEYLDSPTSVGVTEPLSKKPPTGKLIVSLATAEASTKVKDDAAAEAAKALGWTYKTILIGATADGVAKAFDLALRLNPDGITIGGPPISSMAPQLADACERKIPVVFDSNPITAVDLKTYPCIISGDNFNGIKQLNLWAKMVAAELVVQTGGKANIVIYNVAAYKILDAEIDGFKEGMAEFCPACTVDVQDVPVTDFGSPSLPTKIVNYLRSHPDKDWVYNTMGDLADGVYPALQQAGLQDKVRLSGADPTQSTVEALKEGQEQVWAALPKPILGWRKVDAFARYFTGDDLKPTTAFLPTQLLTSETAPEAVLDPDSGYFLGVADYQSLFEDMWHVS